MVSLLPVFTDFSPVEIIQISLALMFFITLSNSLIFLYKNLVAWDWALPLVITGGMFAFLGGSFVTGLSDFSIRFLLWCFLFFIVIFSLIKTGFSQRHLIPLLRIRLPEMKGHFFLFPLKKIREKYGLRIFGGAFMGLCSGLTGLGGGVIISPLLHESSILPLKKISPSIAIVTLFMSVFALSGQQWQGFSLWESASFKAVFPVLLFFAVSGLSLGHFFHSRGERDKRILVVRAITGILFLKVTAELLFSY